VSPRGSPRGGGQHIFHTTNPSPTTSIRQHFGTCPICKTALERREVAEYDDLDDLADLFRKGVEIFGFGVCSAVPACLNRSCGLHVNHTLHAPFRARSTEMAKDGTCHVDDPCAPPPGPRPFEPLKPSCRTT
jgi:hypothetical protein